MANFEELTSEEKFLEFKTELKSLVEKFKNPEDLKTAKFSLMVFEDLNSLAEKVLAGKISESTKEMVKIIISDLNQAKNSLVDGDISISPIGTLAFSENQRGSYITDEIRKNFCAANRVNLFKKLFSSNKVKEESLRNYLEKLSDSQVDDLGEPLATEEIDEIITLRQKIDNNFGGGAI